MNDSKRLLKETNPKAFNELKRVYFNNMPTEISLDSITSDSELLGLFSCVENQHEYLMPICDRATADTDEGCPICKMEDSNATLFLAKQRIKYYNKGNRIESLWICRNCKSAWWTTEQSEEYVYINHELNCFENKQIYKSLSDSHPLYAKEYSDKNQFPLEWISYMGWLHYEENFIWTCSTCNETYEMPLHKRIMKKDKACPYCNGILPTYEHSLTHLYPEVAEEWNKRNAETNISASDIFGDKEGNGVIHGTKTEGYFKCNKCGVIHRRSIKDVIENKPCVFCESGTTRDWTSRVFREMGIFSDEEYYCSWKTLLDTFTCEECGNTYNANLMQRLQKKYICKGCENKKVILGYNSLKDTHFELVKEWSPNNERNPETFLKSNTYNALWICPDCGGEYSCPINEREIGDDSCPYCNNRKILLGFNSLVDTHPELAKEWSQNNERTPDTVIKDYTYWVLWICPECGGEYSYPINEREVGDNSCPYCNNRRVLPGFNSFKVKHPDLMEEWDFINNYILCDADQILDSCSQKVWWKCPTCGHHYEMSPKRRLYYQKRHKKACLYCKGLRRKKHYFFKP